jgi:hypothetical protein
MRLSAGLEWACVILLELMRMRHSAGLERAGIILQELNVQCMHYAAGL